MNGKGGRTMSALSGQGLKVYLGAVIPCVEEKQAVVLLLSLPHSPCGSRMQIPASTVPEITQKLGRNDGSLLARRNSYFYSCPVLHLRNTVLMVGERRHLFFSGAHYISVSRVKLPGRRGFY